MGVAVTDAGVSDLVAVEVDGVVETDGVTDAVAASADKLNRVINKVVNIYRTVFLTIDN